jgi:hypothetical protein
MSSAIYEIRLFLDSPGHIVRAQLRLLVYSTRYLLCLVPALLVLLPPLALLFAPLHARYGLAPLSPDGPALLRIQLDPAAAALSRLIERFPRASTGASGSSRAACAAARA